MRKTNSGTKRPTHPRKPESFSESLSERQTEEKNGSKDGKKTRSLERVENKRAISPQQTNLGKRVVMLTQKTKGDKRAKCYKNTKQL